MGCRIRLGRGRRREVVQKLHHRIRHRIGTFQLRHVTGVLNDGQARIGYSIPQGAGELRRHHPVMLPAQDERGDFYFSKPVRDIEWIAGKKIAEQNGWIRFLQTLF